VEGTDSDKYSSLLITAVKSYVVHAPEHSLEKFLTGSQSFVCELLWKIISTNPNIFARQHHNGFIRALRKVNGENVQVAGAVLPTLSLAVWQQCT
jgi:hypothetical protein